MQMKKTAFVFLFFSLSASCQTPGKDLERLYTAKPGLITQWNPEVLKKEALTSLDKVAAERTYQYVKADLQKFTDIKAAVIARLSPKGLPQIVVLGQFVTGMVAAASAAQSGHPVRVYDTRLSYTRDIQWSSRQTVTDLLAPIDPKLAEKYNTEVSQAMSRGYLSFGDNDHNTRYLVVDVSNPDPRRIPQIASEMLVMDDVAIVQTRVFEKVMYEYLGQFLNVSQKKGKIEIGALDEKTGFHKVVEYEDVTPAGQKEKVFQKVAKGNPITIIPEGAGNSNRSALGIKSAPISPKRLQVAGVVHIENPAEIVTHFSHEGPGRLITGPMETKGAGKRGVVGDVDEAKLILILQSLELIQQIKIL